MKKLFIWLSKKHKGSNHISFWMRRHVEKLNLKQVLGVNLAGFAFAVAIVLPQTSLAVSAWEVTRDVPYVTIESGPTESETQWPLAAFGISQGFHLGHPGMDLTAPFGTPVYPIAAGTVSWTNSLSWGYGNHVFIQSASGLESLYGHLSKITVVAGEHVEKTTKIGEVGATGWATGNHVHLEVYDGGIAINPLDVLPEVK